MTIVIEINRPILWMPGYFHSDLTLIRMWWLFFAITIHTMRYDELLDLAMSGNARWEKK